MNVEIIYEIFHILSCGCEIKQAMILAVMNAIYAIKYIEARNSQNVNREQWCDALTNQSMKPLTLGAGHLWVVRSP